MEAGQRNYICLLNEFAQRNKLSLAFEEVNSDGPAHIKTFTSRAVVNGTPYPVGTGRSKKEANQVAAKNALNGLKETATVNTASNQNVSSVSSLQTLLRYTCWLNEYGQKNRVQFKPIEVTRINPKSLHNEYACKFTCDDKEYPEAVGNNKKDVKEAAAKLAYDELIKEQNTEGHGENANRPDTPESICLSPSFSSLSLSLHKNSESSLADNNFIGMLNNYSQMKQVKVDYIFMDKKGPSHTPEFAYKVTINNVEYPEAKGKSAKEAKQKAARLAWKKLQGISDMSSELMNTSSDAFSSISGLKNPDTDGSIIFKDSSSVHEPRNVDVKAKKLAPNFQNPLISNKGFKESNPSTKETTPVSTPTYSRFLDEFESPVKVGKGGFGRVFKAKRKIEDKSYAVKVVKDNDKARREVCALADFDHPNIVRYYTSWIEKTAYGDNLTESSSNSTSTGPDCKWLYIQMEYCEGETLHGWIHERNSKSELYPKRRKEALVIITQVLRAVEYIHSKMFIHRDLKPRNIMFGRDKEVKVGDFGLVTEEEEENSDGGMLERTRKTGTRSYMSPEQGNLTTYDRKVDIFALGLIYYELLQLLKTQTEKYKMWDNIRKRKFSAQFQISFDFEHKMIEQMLCENPEKRPEASKLLKDLEQRTTTLKKDRNIQRE